MGKHAVELLGLDVGNAAVKAVGSSGSITFPHGLVELSQRSKDDYRMRGELDTNKNIWKVNGTYYKVGAAALEDGAMLRYGESRYIDTYYPVLSAVAMFMALKGNGDVIVMGSHTPKDIIYRPDLIAGLKGKSARTWTVCHRGTERTFRIVGAYGIDEPVGVWRHTVLEDNGETYRKDTRRVRRGVSVILDIGGFTTAWAISRDGLLEYDRSTTHVNGILNVLENLEQLIRTEYRAKLKGVQRLDHMELRKTLKTGKYNAAGAGMLNAADLVDQAVAPLLNDVGAVFERLGGLAGAHSVILGGGGSAALEERIRKVFNHPHMITADPEIDRLHLSTSTGAFKTLRLLLSKGEL